MNEIFGRDFKKSIGRVREISKKSKRIKSGKTLLMKKIRLKIYQHLCEFPCNHLSGIAREFKIAPAIIKFHLEKMCKDDLIKKGFIKQDFDEYFDVW